MSGTMHLLVAGDIFIHESAAGCNDTAHAALLARLSAADCRVGNLDLTITDSGYPAAKPDIYRAKPEVAAEIARLGLDLVTLANTHSTDFGLDGLRQTLAQLHRAGVATVGSGDDAGSAFRPAVLSRNDVRVAVVAVVLELPGLPSTTLRAAKASPGVASIAYHRVTHWRVGRAPAATFAPCSESVAHLVAALSTARAEADVVVLMLHSHWPPPLKTVERGYTVPYLAIDHGADLVLTHGSHEVERIEAYQGRLIAHGLGNLFLQLPRPGSYGFFPETARALTRVWANDAAWSGLLVEAALTTAGPPSQLRLAPLSMSREPPVGFPLIAEGSTRAALIERIAKTSSGVLFEDDARGLVVRVA